MLPQGRSGVIPHLGSFCSRHASEGALAMNIEVFDSDGPRLPIRSDAESHAAGPGCHFSHRLVDEDVALPVLERKRCFPWSHPYLKRSLLFDDLDVAEVIVAIGADVGLGGQSRRLFLGWPGIVR